MMCINCNGEDFEERCVELKPVVNGCEFCFQAKGHECQDCGAVLFDTEQMNIALSIVKKNQEVLKRLSET